MFDSISAEGFRGIKYTDQRIELDEMTILLGRNNAGKSSLLEALYCVFGGSDPLIGRRKVQRVRSLHDSSLLYRYAGTASVDVVIGQYNLMANFDNSSQVHFNLNGRETQSSVITSQFQNKLGMTDRDADSQTMLLSPSYQSYLNLLDAISKKRSEVEKSDLHRAAAEFINQCIDDSYEEIYLETEEMRKEPDDGAPFWVDVGDLGSGVVKALTIYMAVELVDPEVLLWDDMETSLHPSLLRHLLDWLSTKDTQVVASTHSIDVLSALIDVQAENASIVQMSKDKNDVLHHESLDMTELQMVMENAGLDPRFLSNGMDL